MNSGSSVSFASRGLQDLALAHQVDVNSRTGSAAIGIKVPVSPGRAGFQPDIAIAYGSGAPNSAFGLGWNLTGVPSVGLNLTDGLPRYDGSDTFAFAGGELVPSIDGEDAAARVLDDGDHWIHLYRSKVERSFTRLERWVSKGTGRVHWRARDRDNRVSVFGHDPGGQTRISDPNDGRRTFEWLLERQYDRHGNAIHFEYEPENSDGVDASDSFERHRIHRAGAFAQRHLKRIRYGNTRPLQPDGAAPADNAWLFELVFDYGEHDAAPPFYRQGATWPSRRDPFSTYRAGFDVRTYRLCRRILMFHHFRELGTGPTLVGALTLRHAEDPAGSVLQSLHYTGYRRDPATDAYTQRALPPLEFRYTQPAMGHAFVAAPEQTQENLPFGLSGSNYRWIDLHGEGLPGILCETDQAWYFKPNLGGGRLGSQRKVLDKPASRTGNYAFSDFDGDGNVNLVVLQGREAGYYEYDRDRERWAGFRAFSSAPHVKSIDVTTQFLDVTGDGRADLVTIEQDRVNWYRSKGKDGFDAAISLAKPSSNGVSRAPTIGPNPSLDYFFADMTGDGLPDQVLVRNGRVEYWPQLGNGRFGAGVVMEGAPALDFAEAFDASRIRLVDIDGSGTADLLYIGRGEIRYWINASGNRFVEGGAVTGLPYIDNLASAQVFDFLGDGTPCLVWSTALPSQAHASLRYLKLTDGNRPRLLVSVNNAMGREAQIAYGHSARHYLRDKQSGRGWISKLPRHMTVVDRLTVIDQVGNTRFESRYEYHDGFFDGEERAFRGFGLVDQYDADVYRGTSTVPEIEHADPVCVRSWFHNGEAGWESQRFGDYYRGDPQGGSLPGSFIEDPDALLPGEHADAYRAVAGQTIRTESYGIGPDGRRVAHPYQVSQANFRIRRLQPSKGQQPACFAAFTCEHLTYTYEQDPSDPRVSHDLALAVDAFGNVTRSCSVAYPRRSARRMGIDAQYQLHVSVSTADLLNVDALDRYELGISLASRSFEIAGLSPSGEPGIDAQFQRESLAAALDGALRSDRLLRYDQDFTGGAQARLMQWSRAHYWDDTRTDVLPWGRAGPLSLLHHTETAGLTDSLFADTFGSRLTPEAAREDGLYHADEGYWWQAGPTLHYLPASQFNLLTREERARHRDGLPVNAVTTLAYDDPYWLVLTGLTDAVGNRVRAGRIDYHLPAADQIVDRNENVSEVRYDPLGIIVIATQFGRLLGSAGAEVDYGNEPLSDYRPQPDIEFDRILAEPARFLQGVSTFFHYELDTWTSADPQPLRSLSLTREALVHDGEGGPAADSQIQVQVTYLDGFGRNLQSKELVEPGPAVEVDDAGRISAVQAPTRWRASGHAVFDNKQQVVRQYEPFFSTTHAFQSDAELETFGETTVTEYDPMGRVVGERHPNGTRTRIEYAAWATTEHDPNDSIAGSAYEAGRRWLPDTDPEKQALLGAQAHANTPTRVHFDPLGRQVMLVEDGGPDGLRRTESTLDYAGNPMAIVDSRGLTAFTYRRDMLGRVLHEHSIDAGDLWTLTDSQDLLWHSWDGRGVHRRLDHDLLGRVVSVFVDGALGLNQFTERVRYGDEPGVPQAALRNLRGQPVRHHDQAGIIDFHRYDPAGQPLHYDRRLAADYKREPDWRDPDRVALTGEAPFETRARYDALGRVTWQHLADGTTRHIDFEQGGGVRRLRVSTADGALHESAFLTAATFNARGQRIGAVLGNGTAIDYEYDRTTYRLARLYARQPDPAAADRPPLRVYQDIRYTHDPAGNLVHCVDRAQDPPSGDVLSRLRGEVHAASTFRYDAFYQLREATGRAHEALQQHDHDARRRDQPDWIKGTRHLSLSNAAVIRRYTRTYDYDPGGNLTRIGHQFHMPGGDTSRNWHTDLWVSPVSNRSLPALDLRGNPISGPESRFDPETGNCLHLPHLHEFAWNYRNSLAQAVTVSRAADPARADDAEYYVYGSDGMRVRRVQERETAGGLEITEKIYLDGCEIKRVRTGDRLQLERKTSHITDGTMRLALLHQWTADATGRETDRLDRTGIHYQLGNHLGSSSLELDEAGEVISYEEYFPFGGTAFVAGRSLRDVRRKDYRYSGKERDDVTGLYYYGHRYFAPWIGRWLSPDPIGPEDGLNLYQFVQNNPVNLVDPNGLYQTRRFGDDGDDYLHTIYREDLEASDLTQEAVDALTEGDAIVNVVYPNEYGPGQQFTQIVLVEDLLDFLEQNRSAQLNVFVLSDPQVTVIEFGDEGVRGRIRPQPNPADEIVNSISEEGLDEFIREILDEAGTQSPDRQNSDLAQQDSEEAEILRSFYTDAELQGRSLESHQSDFVPDLLSPEAWAREPQECVQGCHTTDPLSSGASIPLERLILPTIERGYFREQYESAIAFMDHPSTTTGEAVFIGILTMGVIIPMWYEDGVRSVLNLPFNLWNSATYSILAIENFESDEQFWNYGNRAGNSVTEVGFGALTVASLGATTEGQQMVRQAVVSLEDDLARAFSGSRRTAAGQTAAESGERALAQEIPQAAPVPPPAAPQAAVAEESGQLSLGLLDDEFAQALAAGERSAAATEASLAGSTPNAVQRSGQLSFPEIVSPPEAIVVRTTNARLAALADTASAGDIRWVAGDPELYRAWLAYMSRSRSQATGRQAYNLMRAGVRRRVDLGGEPIHHWLYNINRYPGQATAAENLLLMPERSHVAVHQAMGVRSEPFRTMQWGNQPGTESGVRSMFIFWISR